MMRRAQACLLVLVLACACERREPVKRASTESGVGPQHEGFQLAAVRYVLALELARTTRDTQGIVHLHTDRGYDVALSVARLSTHSAALVPCRPMPNGAGAESDRGARWLRGLVDVPRAHAGHTSMRDPSLVDGLVEDLLVVSSARELGSRVLSSTRYCRLHYVLGAGTPSANSLGNETRITGPTLELRGIATGSAGVRVPVAVDTKLAHGNLLELERFSDVLGRDGSAITVTITRALGTLLDGVDLATVSAKELERAALTNLVASTQVELSRSP